MGVSKDDAVAAAIGGRTAKTKKGRRMLAKREPKAVENPKSALLVRASNCSSQVCSLLRDLTRIRNPLSQFYSRRHEMHPFEDVSGLENLCNKLDHGLFAFGSSSKKRPARLILGRIFDKTTLDMQEFNVKDYQPMQSFNAASKEAVLGSKPMVVFQGSPFENDERLKRTKSLLLDFFRGPSPNNVLLKGLQSVVVVSAVDAEQKLGDNVSTGKGPVVSVRRYHVAMSKSGSTNPRIELEEMGPHFSLELDRNKDPNREMWKASIKVPKVVKPKKVKNITKDTLGKRNAKIHLGKQHFDQIHTVHHGQEKRKKLQADLDRIAEKKKHKTVSKEDKAKNKAAA